MSIKTSAIFITFAILATFSFQSSNALLLSRIRAIRNSLWKSKANNNNDNKLQSSIVSSSSTFNNKVNQQLQRQPIILDTTTANENEGAAFRVTDNMSTIFHSPSSATLQYINDGIFEQEIIQCKGLKAVLFTADWAGPCRAMANNFIKASLPTYQMTNTKFYQIDTERNPECALKYNVRSIPCVLIFNDSKVVAEIVGTVPAQVVSDYLNKNFGETNSKIVTSNNSNDDEDHFQ